MTKIARTDEELQDMIDSYRKPSPMVQGDNSGWITINENKLTKRERFAIAAMQGLCTIETPDGTTTPERWIPEMAVRIADATIKELEKT